MLKLLQVLTDSGTHVKLFYVSNYNVELRAKKTQEVHLSTITGTMKMQVLSITPRILEYRYISCFCQSAKDVWDCTCSGLQVVVVVVGAVPLTEEAEQSKPQLQQQRPDVIEIHHCGQWCIVRYDDKPYPGIIL